MTFIIDYVFELFAVILFFIIPIVAIIGHSLEVAEGIGPKIFKCCVGYVPAFATLTIITFFSGVCEFGSKGLGSHDSHCLGSNYLGLLVSGVSFILIFLFFISVPLTVALGALYFKLHKKSIEEYGLKDTGKKPSDS